jgi:exodeoxyribonuclease III
MHIRKASNILYPYMNIYSWNINGIRAIKKKGDFDTFINTYQPDILCLQETKATHDQIDIDLPEYEEYWCSADKKGYSGTAIFTKIPPIQAIYGIPKDIATQYELIDMYGDTTKEGRVIVLEFKSIYVVSVYTPNAKDDLSRIHTRLHWDSAFLTYMKRLEMQKPVIFCGDLNVAHTENDLARPIENRSKKGFTSEERHGIDAIIENGFVDTFRLFTKDTNMYTWWSHWGNARERNVGWRIDYIFVSARITQCIKNAQIHDTVRGSDHCPVSIEIDPNTLVKK